MQNHPSIVPQRLTDEQTISEEPKIIQDSTELMLQRIAKVKNQQLHNYYFNSHRNDHDVQFDVYYKSLELGFSSVGSFDSNQVSWEAHARELLKFLQPGFIFEVVVIDKVKETRELIVVIQRFLAFCDRCHSSAFKHHDADFSLFQKHRHSLEVLIKVNTMNIKGVIDDSEVIEDFSTFNYYISYNKIQIGDHLNAVVLQVDQDQRLNKPILQMSLKNKCILGGKMWSLVNLQEPKTFSLATPVSFRLGFTKMIGKAFENAAKPKETQIKQEEETQNNLKFKEEFNVFSFHYQIQNDVFFLNKQNYDLMAKSLKLNQFHSLCSKNNLTEIKALNLDYHRLSKVSAGQAPLPPQPKPVMLQKNNVIAKI